mgnify:CR=1 FL=1
MPHWLPLALIALVAWGITGNTQKISTNCISKEFAFIGFSVAFIPVALLTLALFPVRAALPAQVVALGLLSGALNGFGALTSFAAFEKGAKSAVAVPLMYLYPLITVLLAWGLLHERISAAHWAGIGLAPLAAWLLSSE